MGHRRGHGDNEVQGRLKLGAGVACRALLQQARRAPPCHRRPHQHVLVVAVHRLAQLHEVDEHSLLGALARHLQAAVAHRQRVRPQLGTCRCGPPRAFQALQGHSLQSCRAAWRIMAQRPGLPTPGPTCGGLSVVRRRSPVSSGLWALRMPNTRSAASTRRGMGVAGGKGSAAHEASASWPRPAGVGRGSSREEGAPADTNAWTAAAAAGARQAAASTHACWQRPRAHGCTG